MNGSAHLCLDIAPDQGDCVVPEGARAQGLQEGDRTASGPGPQRRAAAIFCRRMTSTNAASPRGNLQSLRLCIARQNSRRPPSSAALRPPAVQAGAARRQVIAGRPRWARPIRQRSITMAIDRDIPDFDGSDASSPTDSVLIELQLYGHRPFQDEPDPRPLPEARVIGGAVADIFDALVSTLSDTRLEPDLENLLWSTVNVFHRAADRVHRELDDNEVAQKRSQKEQDGSEIRSVEMERLVAEGLTLIERRNCMELFRDQAADQFEHHTGSSWRPRSGSMVNHRTLTAAMIDSRDFLAAKRRSETEVLLPAGPKIAFTGGFDFNDHQAIWAKLDQVRAKHPEMVLLHGGSPKGAERIAACWADSRKVPQIVFKPDWNRHGRAAPFKRNDRILDVLPIGVIVFPGSGISANLADKAKKLGIPVWKFAEGGA
jgi:hypothetical protein